MKRELWWSCKNCSQLFAAYGYEPLCPSCSGYPTGSYRTFESTIIIAIVFAALLWMFWPSDSRESMYGIVHAQTNQRVAVATNAPIVLRDYKGKPIKNIIFCDGIWEPHPPTEEEIRALGGTIEQVPDSKNPCLKKKR